MTTPEAVNPEPQQSEELLPLRERLAEVGRTARAEHGDTSMAEKAGLYATLGGIAFEWGTGNEALLGLVGANIHKATHNAVATGLGTGAVSFAEQGLLGVGMAYTISNFPRVADSVRNLARRPGETSEKDEAAKQGALYRFGGSMMLGSAVELAIENARNPHTQPENTRRALSSAAIIGASNTLLIGGISAAAKFGEDHGHEHATDVAINYASNPLTYAAVFGTIFGVNKLRRKFGGKSEETSETKVDPTAEAYDPINLPEAHTLIQTKDGLSVTVSKEVNQEDQDKVWKMLKKGFSALNRQTYEKQDMERNEFDADMASSEVFKYIARNKSGKIVGYTSVHANLDNVTWVNTEHMKEAQHELDPNVNAFYLNTIVVPKNLRGLNVARRMLQATLIHLKDTNTTNNGESYAFFDCAEANYPKIPKFAASSAKPDEEFAGARIKIEEMYSDSFVKKKGSKEVVMVRTEDVEPNDKIVDKQRHFSFRLVS